MDAIEQLLSQGFGSVIITILLVLIAAKFIWELVDFFYKKIKKVSNNSNEYEDALSTINEITDKLNKMEDTLSLVQERLQENTRSYLIDAHHKYVYESQIIDDITLQSLERRYLYYKRAGGDSFIEKLMQEIRELPRSGIANVNTNVDLLAQWK